MERHASFKTEAVAGSQTDGLRLDATLGTLGYQAGPQGFGALCGEKQLYAIFTCVAGTAHEARYTKNLGSARGKARKVRNLLVGEQVEQFYGPRALYGYHVGFS